MLLPAVSLVDCAAFVFFLAIQLLLSSSLGLLLPTVLPALRFLLFTLPADLVRERYLNPLPHSRYTTLFQDTLFRCIKWCFTHLPLPLSRLFFTKPVVLPFLYFRLLRSAHFSAPPWTETRSGLWLQHGDHEPDLVLLYIHGGGFALGSVYFYLEFLLTWLGFLRSICGFRNPAILALRYTPIPEAVFPAQLRQAEEAYAECVRRAGPQGRVVVAGDSAGGALVLSLLVALKGKDSRPVWAGLISPWVQVMGGEEGGWDYLEMRRLREFGEMYAAGRPGGEVSPELEVDWESVMPDEGIGVYYAKDEVLARGIDKLVDRLRLCRKAGVTVREVGVVHAWVVAAMFLADGEERTRGLRLICADLKEALEEEVRGG